MALGTAFGIVSAARTARRAGLAASVVTATVLTLGAARPAFAYDDGYQNVFSSVLGAVGVLPQDAAPEIDYRERPPLVLPPKATLVKPEATGTRRTAAWPSDPDVVRRRKEAAEARAPTFGFDRRAENETLSRDEQMKYRAEEAARPELDAQGCNAFENSMAHCRPNVEEMKAQEERFKKANPDHEEAVVAGKEPTREYLTQPPSGYRVATKNVAVTHEAPVKNRDTSSPLSTYIKPVDNKSIDPLNN